MSKKSLFAALAVVFTVFVTGCLGPSPEQKYGWFAPYEKAFSLGDDRELWDRRSAFLKQCMQDQGFRFELPDFVSTKQIMERNRSVEYAQEYGYGIFTNPPQPEVSDSYRKYLEALSPEEYQKWEQAYYGGGEQLGCVQRDDYPLKFMQTYNELLEAYNQIDVRAFDDKNVLEVTKKWAQCMADRGEKSESGRNYLTLNDPIAELQKQAYPPQPEATPANPSAEASAEAATPAPAPAESPAPAATPTPAPAETPASAPAATAPAALDEQTLKRLSEKEKASAVANMNCLQEVNFWAAYADAQNTLREKFIKENESKVEEFMKVRKGQ